MTDVDLDCSEAVDLGSYFLPPTDAIFGRPSKRNSHFLYFTEVAASDDRATIQFKDPNRPDDKGMLLEVRIGGGDKGAQTVFPGSTHAGGEEIRWETDGTPARVEDADFMEAAHRVATASLFVRYMPGSGLRHGAPLEPEEIKRLVSLQKADLAEFARVRSKLKDAGCLLAMLDRAIAKAARTGREGVSKDIVSDVEPWPDAVDGRALLGEIEATIKRFLVCGVFAPVALSLWIAATWLADAFHVAPILNIVSPELRCGKTTCLDIVSRLVRRSMTTSNISPPAMFRSIEKFQPTLIIDEADAFFSENEDLRGIINSGHTRPTAYVIRTVGDDHEPKKFTTWAFKAIAGIGKRAATIEDRSIGIALKRKLPDEKVERLRYAKAELFETLARKLARWTLDNAAAVAAARPALPESLNDRQQDNWEPLLAIAAVAGGSWPERAREAATRFSTAPGIMSSKSTDTNGIKGSRDQNQPRPLK